MAQKMRRQVFLFLHLLTKASTITLLSGTTQRHRVSSTVDQRPRRQDKHNELVDSCVAYPLHRHAQYFFLYGVHWGNPHLHRSKREIERISGRVSAHVPF